MPAITNTDQMDFLLRSRVYDGPTDKLIGEVRAWQYIHPNGGNAEIDGVWLGVDVQDILLPDGIEDGLYWQIIPAWHSSVSTAG